MWTSSDLIKGLWIFRKSSTAEPRIWWNAHFMAVFGAAAPDAMTPEMLWQLAELRWTYVEAGELGEPHWMLRNVGG